MEADPSAEQHASSGVDVHGSDPSGQADHGGGGDQSAAGQGRGDPQSLGQQVGEVDATVRSDQRHRRDLHLVQGQLGQIELQSHGRLERGHEQGPCG